MNTYIISYITKSGIVCLNVVLEAKTRFDAMDQIREEMKLIISIVSI